MKKDVQRILRASSKNNWTYDTPIKLWDGKNYKTNALLKTPQAIFIQQNHCSDKNEKKNAEVEFRKFKHALKFWKN